MTRSLLYRLLAITFLVLPCLFVNGPNASAQRNKEIPVRELLSIPGKLVSEAKSSRPTTELKLTGYRVEEINLPRQLNVEVRGQQVAVDKAWRVTLQGGPFPVRAMPAGGSRCRSCASRATTTTSPRRTAGTRVPRWRRCDRRPATSTTRGCWRPCRQPYAARVHTPVTWPR